MKKRIRILMLAVAVVIALAVPAFAADGGGAAIDMGAIFGESVNTISDNIVAMVKVVLPVGLGIIGIYIALGAGKKVLKLFTR